MSVFARMMFGLVQLAARKGVADEVAPGGAFPDDGGRRRTGVRGETFAYWYLRRHGYTMIARNFTAAGVKGEIDLIAYDGEVLAFVEVKTRTTRPREAVLPSALPEAAVNPDKRRNVARMARLFLAQRRLSRTPWRYDVVAIESPRGARPVVRLHKGAFADR